MSLNSPRDLVELFLHRAEEASEELLYTFLPDGRGEAVELRRGELVNRARGLAARLRAVVSAAGDETGEPPRALLLFSPGVEFVVAFFACLWAGVVAVPAYPPRRRRSAGKGARRHRDERLQSVVEDAQPALVVTEAAIAERSEELCAEVRELAATTWVATDGEIPAADPDWDDGLRRPELAFLQYTSGSTSAPKGVRVTHASLLHNEEAIRRAFGTRREDVVVGWLPLYHDMGLIGNLLQPLYVGARCVLMSPQSFLHRPVRWLQTISEHGGTISGGPNFAYDLCVRRIGEEQRSGLDLSGWRVAFNGSEPVLASTLERFSEAFAATGFRRRSFFPCYGLAEATLFVSGTAPGEPPVVERFAAPALEADLASPDSDGRPLVSSGRAGHELEVRIVEAEDGRPLDDGQVGEIWVSSPSVADGYWGRPEHSGTTFRARLAASDPSAEARAPGPFLRTGDLGFSWQGELYVTGRLKDLVILRGRNLYPQDIEHSVETAHPALRSAGAAAFTVLDDEVGERLVVVVEVERRRERDLDAEEVAEAVRTAVAADHQAQIAALVLIRAGTLPRTSSGKVRRSATRHAFATGGLTVVAEERLGAPRVAAAPGDPRREVGDETLAGVWELPPDRRRDLLVAAVRGAAAEVLELAPETVDPQSPLTALGLDSLAAVELHHRLDARLSRDGEATATAIPAPGALLEGMSSVEVGEALENGRGAPAPLAVPAHSEPAAPIPLSLGQEALWLVEDLLPGTSALNLGGAVEVMGRLDGDALERALDRLAGLYPELRTTFPEIAGETRRVIDPEMALPLHRERLSAMRVGAVSPLLADRVLRPFDRRHGPLFRLGLVEVVGGGSYLYLAIHHLISDLWSIRLLLRALEAFYAEETGGAPATVVVPERSFADFVRWQRDFVEGAEADRLSSRWRRRLEPAPRPLDLPTDHPRRTVRGVVARRVSRRLDRSLSTEVSRWGAGAAQHPTTPNVVLLATLQALLHRYTGRHDFLVGFPTAGRDRPEVSRTLGYFINPLPLRADLGGRPGFAELVERTRSNLLASVADQALPLPVIIGEALEGEGRRAAPFDAFFVFERAEAGDHSLAGVALDLPDLDLEFAGLELRSLRLNRSSPQFDLLVYAAQVGDTLALAFEYDAELFDAATVERLAGHFENLLRSGLEEDGWPLDRLAMLAPEEEHQLLREWNPEVRVDAAETALHRAFEAQARHSPETPAVVHGLDELSYGDLNAAANRLARRLRRLGIRRGHRVGLCTGRGHHVVTGILGILKAGAAYVPVDPAYPARRLGWILEDGLPADGSPAVLVTGPGWSLPFDGEEGIGLPTGLVRCDLDDPSLAEERGDDLEVEISSRDLAYVLFTSGSTGRPKGVAVTHGNVGRLFTATEPWFGFGADDVWTLFHSYAFDFSVWEIWGALLHGGCLVVVPFEVSRDPLRFHRLLVDERVTVLNQTPSAFRQLMAAEEEGAALHGETCLRWVVFGGEALDLASLAPWFVRHGEERPKLVNMYGITETTVHVTHRPVGSVDLVAAGSHSPIGQPIPDLELHLLDRAGRLVPVGVPGEIHVGGAGLAWGYWRRPGLTAERFLPDPVGSRPGARLYCSGDVGRRRADGDVEYLGRLDQQIQLRGFRVELGEIEAALGRHPAVRQAVVVARDEGAESRLVAYAVARRGEVPVADLLAHARRELPDYMVPSRILPLESIPLTPTGKLDRGSLPDAAVSPTAAPGHPPETPAEAALARLWSRLLGVETGTIRRDSNFFELGGHSLLATRLVARLRDDLGVELAIARVFDTPILADLAAVLAERGLDTAATEPPPATPAPPERPAELPLSPAQERLWFLHQLAPESPAYHIPFSLTLRGPLAPAVLRGAVSVLLRRHEALRTHFPQRDGRPRQRVEPPGAARLPLVDLGALQSGRRREAAAGLARRTAVEPFELPRGPLARFHLLRLAADEHRFRVDLHHAVADGWSLGVLARELAEVYSALVDGRPASLPPLPWQLADHALVERSRDFGHDLAFWEEHLGDYPRTLDLPRDRPRPEVASHRGGRLPVPLPADTTQRVSALARRWETTPFALWAAVFGALLGRLAGQPRLLLGYPTANRTRPSSEGLIGLFVNTLVLPVDLGGDPSFRVAAARLGAQAGRAHDHQEVPFERVVEALGESRDLSRSPLFQVMLATQEEAAELHSMGEVEVGVEALETRTAKFDLQLELARTGDELDARLEYAADLFDATTVMRWVGSLVTLLRGAMDAPETPLGQLSLLAPGERHQLLVETADTGRRYPHAGEALHRAIERVAERSPGAVAVEDGGGRRLTYGELDEAANRVSHRLRDLGAGPGTRVGVCAERSLELVVGLMGTVKAGAAYVPLDPDYPDERLRFMAADGVGDGGVVLVAGAAAELDLGAVRRIDLADLWRGDTALGSASRRRPALEVHPDSLAYVIYTSGSTGRPKGVMNAHRGIVNRLQWMQEAFGLTPGDVVMQKTPASFDVSVWEFFWPLRQGARLVLAAPGGHRNPAYLVDRIAASGVTTIHFVPSMLRAFLGAEVERCTSLRRVICSGEALSWDLEQETLRRLGGHAGLFNLYGPTEAAVDVTWWTCRESPVERAVPLGRAVANTTMAVVDRHASPVPIGVAGELWIGGVQVARGYQGRPALTAERLIPDPRGGAGARAYRTGDLGRRRSDGHLEYLGRLDHQVKVRGFRIELGEIESVLRGQAGVADAVVVAHGGDDGAAARLVAYLVADGAAPTVEELRRELGDRLPEHMVPSWFEILDAMPQTPSGKVDRRALPEPGGDRPDLEASYVAPRTDAEDTLAGIWRQVLGVDRVGVHDNFFSLGGDSILSIQVVSRAASAGWSLEPHDLFKHQTLARLAAAAESAAPLADAGDEAVPAAGPAPLAPIQRWFFEQDASAVHHFNQAVMLAAEETPDLSRLAAALEHLADHHAALRLRFTRGIGDDAGPAWGQRFLERTAPAVRRVDLSALPTVRRRPVLEAAAAAVQTALDVIDGPVMRCVWFDLAGGTDGGRLLLALHHLVVDGVSWRILLDDLEALYRSGPEALPPSTASFQRWVRRLEELAGNAAVLEQADWWLSALPAAPPTLRPDLLRNGVAEEGSGGAPGGEAAWRLFLPEGLTGDVLTTAADHRLSVQELLLAALARALGGEGEGLRLDMEGHGRAPWVGLDVSRTVGWLTSLYPLHLPTPGGPVDTLVAVRRRLAEVPGDGLPFGIVRYLGNPDHPTVRRLREVRPAPVLFNYLGRLDGALAEGSAFTAAREEVGPTRGGGRQQSHPLELVVRVEDGRLRCDWSFDPGRLDPGSLRSAAHRFESELEGLARHLKEEGMPVAAPALAAPELDPEFVAELERRLGPVEEVHPLSPLQEGILFHVLESPGSDLYFEQLTCRLRGGLDPVALRRAWAVAVRRHPILRTAFLWRETERPLQAVARDASLPWRAIDWRSLGKEPRRRELRRLMAADRRRGFDLGRPSLMRLTLIRLPDAASGGDPVPRHRLLWSFHHLLLDGWSLPLLLGEVFRRYEAGGTLPGDEQAPPSYGAYLSWLAGRDAAADRAYWSRHLADFTAASRLVIDRGAGAPAARSRTVVHRFDPSRTRSLQEVARRHHLTVNTLFQGSWAWLLAHYGGRDDVVFGAVVAGRPAELPGADETLGLFINTLPVRVRPDRGRPAAEWLARLQLQEAEARRHQYAPLPEIRRASEVPGGEPLFETLLVFENYPLDETLQRSVGSLEVRELDFHERTHYPLTLKAVPGETLEVSVTADSGRFAAADVDTLVQRLVAVLEGFAGGLQHPAPSLLLPGESEQVLMAWPRQAPAAETGALPLADVWHRTVAHHPDATAVVSEERSMTFGELETAACRLARFLLDQGVGAGDHVALVLDRRCEVYVGVLAALEIGAAFVPLAPGQPAARTRAMLQELRGTGARCIALTVGEGAELEGSVPVFDLEDRAGEIASRDGGALPAPPSDDLPAYVIFTSGSTGRPKPTVIRRRSLAHLINGLEERVYAGWTVDRVAQNAPFAFDAALKQLFQLLRGRTLHPVPEAVRTDAEAFLAFLRRHRVDVLDVTPSQLRPLLDAGLEDWPGDRPLHLLVAGEATDGATWDRLIQAAGLVPWNLYGPTECTVDVTASAMAEGEPGTLGRPLAGVEVFVLSPRLEPVPPGLPGELLVGGTGLALGYFGRPGRTAVSFVPHPWPDRPGQRLYRTGDLVRWRADGRLTFVGRADDQLKVRGHRVEPGEIETALGDVPGVAAAAVAVRSGPAGNARLVAYLVPAAPEEEVDTGEVRRRLAATLPGYMVPSAFEVLDRLPTTAAGKLDRGALPEPRWDHGGGEEAPRGTLEERLAAIWERVLGVDRIGRHDDFFALGGDSILSIRITTAARREGITLGPGQLFENPTVAGLATVAGTVEGVEAEQGPVVGEVPLTPIQRSFLDRRPAVPGHHNQALLLRAPAAVPGAMARAVETVLEHHDALRLRLEREGSEDGATAWRQRFATSGGPVPYGHLDLSALRPAAASDELERAAARLQASLCLARGPVCRFAGFTLGDDGERGSAGSRRRLLAAVHHLAVDAVSWPILLEDLEAARCAWEAGRRPRLPAKTSSFRDWSLALREHTGEQPEAELDYWRHTCGAEVPPLPCDGPGGVNLEGTAGHSVVLLDDAATAVLESQLSEVYLAQPHEALVAALSLALAGWTGGCRCRIDIEGHGRSPLAPELDLSRTVGWFTAVHPVLLELPPEVVAAPESGTAAADALAAVKEQLRAVPRGGVGYGVLRHLAGDGGRPPVPEDPAEVVFNYLGRLDRALDDGSPFAPAPEDPGPQRDGRNPRSHLLEVVAGRMEGGLELRFTYSHRLHRPNTIDALAQVTLSHLRALASGGQAITEARYAPSDFPDAALSQQELDSALAEIEWE